MRLGVPRLAVRGVKGSGFGRENAMETLHESLRSKNIRFVRPLRRRAGLAAQELTAARNGLRGPGQRGPGRPSRRPPYRLVIVIK